MGSRYGWRILVVGGAQHNVVFVATQHDSVYALDADASACTVLWHANLLDAAHGVTASEEPVPSNKVGVGAGDIQPEIGVTGTPVIDPSTGILYARREVHRYRHGDEFRHTPARPGYRHG